MNIYHGFFTRTECKLINSGHNTYPGADMEETKQKIFIVPGDMFFSLWDAFRNPCGGANILSPEKRETIVLVNGNKNDPPAIMGDVTLDEIKNVTSRIGCSTKEGGRYFSYRFVVDDSSYSCYGYFVRERYEAYDPDEKDCSDNLICIPEKIVKKLEAEYNSNKSYELKGIPTDHISISNGTNSNLPSITTRGIPLDWIRAHTKDIYVLEQEGSTIFKYSFVLNA